MRSEFDKMDIPLVSIVVPIYNSELYLRECVNSVLSQTYTNFELLLIDDGSTDSSAEICDDLAEGDDRIKVFHKKNGGVCESRNLGKNNAHGEFLMFLDSDDFWMSNTVLMSLVDMALKKKLDVVRGEYVRVNENGENLGYTNPRKKIQRTVYNSFDMVNDVVKGEFFSVLFLIRTNLVKNLFFDTSLVFGEDTYFLIQMFCLNLRCGYLPSPFYAYRQVSSSASNRINVLNVINSFSFCDRFYNCAFITQDDNISNLYIYNSIMMYYWTLQTLASDSYYDKYKEIDCVVHLADIQNRVCQRAKKMKKCHFPLHIYVEPRLGIFLFRLRWKVGRILRLVHIIH